MIFKQKSPKNYKKLLPDIERSPVAHGFNSVTVGSFEKALFTGGHSPNIDSEVKITQIELFDKEDINLLEKCKENIK